MTHTTEPTIDEQINDILNQVAYRGYVAGQGKDRGDAENLYIQSNIVVERATTIIKALISDQVAKARIEAFDVAFDCHDYDRLRAYRAELLKEVK